MGLIGRFVKWILWSAATLTLLVLILIYPLQFIAVVLVLWAVLSLISITFAVTMKTFLPDDWDKARREVKNG